MAESKKIRCAWVGGDQEMVVYHDREWGRPEYRSEALFEKLLLDGFQAGLSWRTILHRRLGMREALWGFAPEKLAQLSDLALERLMKDARLIRHPKKIAAIRTNAQAYLRSFRDKSFSRWIWQFAPARRQGPLASEKDIPTETEESRLMSQALRQLGFSFCGPTICYAFMQAVGLVDDHIASCFLAPKNCRDTKGPRRSGRRGSRG